MTTQEGNCTLSFKALTGVEVYAVKEGHYYASSSRGIHTNLKFNPFIYRKDTPERQQQNPPMKKKVSLKGEIALRKIIKPTPLYAKKVRIDIPIKNQWIGFDCQHGDWVQPHGKGIRSDLYIKSDSRVMDNNNYDLHKLNSAELSIKTTGGGFHKVTEDNGYMKLTSSILERLLLKKCMMNVSRKEI